MVVDADVSATHHSMAEYRYADDGPLWAMRFLPWSPRHDKFVQETSILDGEDDTAKMPVISHIVITCHHSITDGFSFLQMMRKLLFLINDVVTGTIRNDNQQIGVLTGREEEICVLRDMERGFREDDNLYQARLKYSMEILHDNLFVQTFIPPKGISPTTLCYRQIFDKETTKKFAINCKEEGVTFHTGFSSVIDASLVELLNKSGVKNNQYVNNSIHPVNNRCYYNNDSKSLGCIMGSIGIKMISPADILEKFWDYAKQFHSKFKEQHKIKNSLERFVFAEMGNPIFAKVTKLNSPELPLKPAINYVLNNMCDVSDALDIESEHVRLQFYDRLTVLKCFPVLWGSTIQTFRGQLMHSVHYNAHYMEANTAQTIAKTVAEIIMKVS